MAEEVKPEEDPCACTIPLKEWMELGDEDLCRSCMLAPLTQWYRDELVEQGLGDIAKEIEEAGEREGPVELSQKLDEIKERVSDDVKERLREFDCEAQLYTGEDNVEEESNSAGPQ